MKSLSYSKVSAAALLKSTQSFLNASGRAVHHHSTAISMPTRVGCTPGRPFSSALVATLSQAMLARFHALQIFRVSNMPARREMHSIASARYHQTVRQVRQNQFLRWFLFHCGLLREAWVKIAYGHLVLAAAAPGRH